MSEDMPPSLWEMIRLDLAERLLELAIRVAPPRSHDGRRLVVSAMEYFWKIPKNIRNWPPVKPPR